MNTFDCIVIGAGPAGQSAAVRAAQLGKRTLLIEKERAGGTCLNRGCIPTKFLWESLSLQTRAKRGADLGAEIPLSPPDLSKVLAKKNRAVELLSKSLRRTIESHGVVFHEGTASFSGPRELTVSNDGKTETFSAARIIITAGSRPKSFAGITIDHRKFIDSTDALSLETPPGKLLIVGGGAVGVEMANIFSRFGSAVTLIERMDQLLPGEDRELAVEVFKSLERLGVAVATGTGYSDGMEEKFDKVLIVTGRASAVEGLDLKEAGITTTPRGIAVDERLQTSVPGVYAAGDVTGECYLAYTAQAEGIAAAENACGGKGAVSRTAIPRAVFSYPPAASVGVREQDRPADSIRVGRFPFSANARAFIEGERTGWVKIVAEKDSNRIIGGHIIGPGADDLIAILSLAISRECTLEDMRREIFFHPSLSEAIQAACEDALGQSTELPRLSKK